MSHRKRITERETDNLGFWTYKELSNQKLLLDDNGGEVMTQKSISQYESVGDSKSLKEIDGQSFTIVKVEESNYDDQPGVKITTAEGFNMIDGEEYNKFHTTRHAIVKKLSDEKLRADLESGVKIGPVKCEKQKAKTKGVQDYWMLVDV